MSKYIRTEKGRIVTPIGFDPVKGVEIYDSNEFKLGDGALKTADKIEDLCDEFVITDAQENHLQVPADCRLPTWYKDEMVYGAIWTDKGLIYVAKMNAKGELELI